MIYEFNERIPVSGVGGGPQVDAIRAEYAAGAVYQRDLAAKYGVTQSLVSHIVNKKRRTAG